MSIQFKIPDLEYAGKLQKHTPRHKAAKRRLYLANSAFRELDNPTSAICTLVGKGYVEQALDWWTSGGRLWGDDKRGLFLDRLCRPPPEIWEIRISEPIIKARVFCRFAEQDTLIATHIHTRNLLGKRNSKMWERAMLFCEASWQSLFGSCGPHSGIRIGDYVSENYDDFPLCKS